MLAKSTSGRRPSWSICSLLALLFLLSGCGNNYSYTGDHTDKNDYGLSITPAAPIVTAQHSLQLTAKSPWGSGAAWSVLPASAGTIDGTGKFTAGSTPTAATIVAMWKDDVRYTATAGVNIVAPPVATVTVPSSIFTRNTSEAATVPTQANSTYVWSIQGGTLLSGQGTPQVQFTSTNLGSVQLTCTVANAAGDSATGQTTVTIIDVAPGIEYAPAYTLTRGIPAPAILPASSGGAVVTWSISPGLPAGLSFNPTNGQITGTSINLQAATPFIVTATNTGGSASATFTLATVDSVPVISYNPSTFVLPRGSPITSIVPASSGGAITSWSIAPALPTGLSFSSANGTITGNPSQLNPATRYVVTGTNTGGSATATLEIAVVDPVPAIQYTPATQTLVRGAPITPLIPSNTGGAAITWQISPSLPSGLTFDTPTGTISGSPTTPSSTATFTVTATNTGGTSNAVVLTLTVVDSAPVFSFAPAAYVETINAAITPITPNLTHGTATSWSIAPALPAGLVTDPATGRITGTPTVLSPAVFYTVTATNIYGSSTTSAVSITVVDTPPVIHYTPSAFSFTKGAPTTTLLPIDTGGTALSWTISPALPGGLTFDTASGHISGTPTTLSASATYAVTATNTGGTSNPFNLSFAVVDVIPTIGYSPSVFVFTHGQAISPVLPVSSGGSATSWTISPGLPTGLAFDSASGRISGTPGALSSAATYTVTATNTGGASTPLTLTLSVVDIVPVITYPSQTVTGSVGSPITALVPTNSGGPATSWSVHPALPAGLTFDPASGAITGTSTIPIAPATYSITATNTGGTSQPYILTFNLVAVPTAALTASTPNPLYGAVIALTPTFTGATSASIGTTRGAADVTASPTTGLAFTTAVITAPKTFWLRAINAAGDSADASVAVTPQTVAVGSVAPASPTRTTSSLTTFSAVATGGVTNAVTWTATAGTIDPATGAWTAPSAAGPVTITATSRDDISKAASTIVTVVGGSTATLTASTPTPLFGAPVTLTPTFTGAVTATVGTTHSGSDLSTSAISGTGIATPAITSARTFWLHTVNAAGDAADASVLVTPQTVVVTPISPAAPTRTVGTQATFAATAAGGATNTLLWSASGGTINPNTGAWTAPGTPGTATITAASKDDPTKSSVTTVTVVAVGTAAIAASTSTPLYGASVLLTPTFSSAASGILGTTAGASDVSPALTSGSPVTTAALTTPKTFWLRATNAAGDHVDASILITPQTVAISAITPAAPTRTVGSNFTFAATATGGLTNSLTWTASAGTINPSTGAWTAPASGAIVTITATSLDDSSKFVTTTVNVVAAGTSSLTATTATPLFGATDAVTPLFTGATTATVGTSPGAADLSASATSGVALPTGAITITRTFWLRVTNAAGDSLDSSATITPQTVSLTAITPAAPTRTASTTTTFTTTASGGVTNAVTWTATSGTIDPNTGAWTAPAAAASVTITATSKDDPTKLTSTTVNVVAAATASITASTTSPLFGATATVRPVFAGTVTAVLGTTPGASDLSSAPVSGANIPIAALTTPKTFYLHATNAAGDAVDASVTLTPQAVVVNSISPAAPSKTVNSSTAFSTTAANGVTNGISWSATAGTIDPNTGIWTAPPSPGSSTITATSRDDASKSASTTVTVVAAATASISASPTSPAHQATSMLTPTFTGAVTASVGTSRGASDTSSTPTSGLAITTPALATSTTFWIRATNAAGDSVDASTTVTPQTVAVSPITPAAPTRTVGNTTTFSATATGGLTNNITWSATAGTITSAGAWTAPATAGSVTITATAADDVSKTVSTTVNVVAAPAASISASTLTPLFGATDTIVPTFSSAQTAVIGSTAGASDISASPVTNVGIPTAAVTSPKTFYLHVVNVAGDAADASVTVTPQTVIINALSPSAIARTVNTSTTFSTTATGGVTNGLTWTATAGTISSAGVWTAPSAAIGSVTITATSRDDTSKSASTTVAVVAVPTVSIAVSPTSPAYGATVAIIPTFTGSTSASVGTTSGGSDISSAPTSGTSITSAGITAAKTFYLTATNAAGTSATASVTVAKPVITVSAVTSSVATVSVGYPASVKSTVTNAVNTTVDWTATGGSFTSPGTSASGAYIVWTAPTPATNTTYTLTATSDADQATHVTKTISVVLLPTATSLTPSNTSPLYGATVNLTPVFSAGTGSVNQSVGTVTSGTARTSLALTTPIIFSLTVTNAAGQTATVNSATVTPQTVSVATPTAAQAYLTTSHSQAYAAVVSGALNTAVTWTSGGAGTWSGSTWTAPAIAGTYTITATSVADPTKSSSTTATVVNPPVITSFSPASPLISSGYPTTLTAVYTNGSGTAIVGTTGSGSSDLAGSITSGTAVSTGNLTASTTFTVTVYNQAGNSTSASTTVTVVLGVSTPIVSLSGPRYAHTATLLPDSTVLLAGGQNGTSVLATSQLFNPATPAFTDAGTMVSARFGHTATLLPNNTILLTGGNNGSTLATSELWNGSFAATGSLNTAREKHTATLLPGGQVLIVGGLNGSSPVVTAELYNPSTGTFTYTAGNLATARYGHTATLLSTGKVLISGGFNGSVPLRSAEIFDPATGAFTVTGSMATGRQRHAAVTLNDGTVAIIGGQGSSAPLASAEIFNPATSTFTATGSMANARDGLTATLLAGGKVLVAGGIDATGAPVDGSEIFNPSTGTFGLTALLATARTQHTATLLQTGNVLLAGGLVQSGNQASATATAELVNPQDGLTPTIPVATTTAPVGATRAQTGLTASIPSQTHVGYVWMITGGTITAGQGTNSITFSMPSSGTATLDALVTSDRLVPSHVQTVVTPKPVITVFTSARSTVSVGSSTSLSWTVQDATSLSIDQAVGAVTGSSTPVTVGSLGTTNYTLTATNAGGSVTATTSVLAVPLPVAASLTAAAGTVSVGGNTSLTPTFSQGTGVITPSIGAVQSGPAYPTPAISSPTTFTLTVTNAAGDTATRTATVGLQAVSVTGISGQAYITAGHTGAYTAAVSGSVNTAVVWQSSAGSIDSTGILTAPTGSPYSATPTTITVTATSVNGGTPATLNVTVVPLPAITSFTLNPATVNYGSAGTMTPVFSLGTGQIATLGSVTSGQAVSTANLTSAKSFTLTVTNLAGDAVTQSLTAPVANISVSAPTPTGQIITTGDTIAFTSSVSGSSNTKVTWSANGGSFGGNSPAYDPLGNPQTVVALSANTWTAPAAGSYTITANSVSPTGYLAGTPITVVGPPIITSFGGSTLSITTGNSTNITPVFSNGTATITPGNLTPTSGTAFSTGTLTATTTYKLTVINAAGLSTSRWVTVNVVKGATSTISGTMAAGRSGHTVTLLADGGVLLAGGNSSTTAERYSAFGALNTIASPMVAVRYRHTATLLANGKVLLAGGSNGTSAQSSAELFDPVAGTFTASSGTMTSARQNHTAALLSDGRVLLSGGIDASSAALSSTDIYDPVTDTFTAGPAFTAAAELLTSTSLQNGTVLIAGGDNNTNATAAAQLFANGTLNSLSLAHARTQHTSTLLAGGTRIFLSGGLAAGSALNSSEVSNGSSFASTTDLTTARYGHAANLLQSGQVLLLGGTTDGQNSLASVTLYDPGEAQIYTTGGLSTARFEPVSTILRSGKVLIAGGASDPTQPLSTSLNTLELYDPQDGLTPILPTATITAPVSAPNGTTGLTASVPLQYDVDYVWSITNGTITAGLNTSAITFTRGSGPTVLNLLVVSDRQVPVQGSATIVPIPVISSFAATTPATIGLPATLSWTAAGAPGMTLTIDHGIGDVTSLNGSTTITTPSATTTYTLTATDTYGTTTQTVALNAVPAPVFANLVAAVNPIEKGGSTTIVSTFSNGSATINNGVGAVLSGVAYPTGTLNASTVFTATVTNAAGTSVSGTLNLAVMPVVVSAISGPVNVTIGSTSAQFSAIVTGAINKTVTWLTSAGSINPSTGILTAPATTQDLVVTATSVADSTQTSQLTVHVVAVPVATGMTAATNPVLYGGTTTITPAFTQGTGAIDQGVGPVTSGTAYSTGIITASKTFTLTVTNASGNTATYPLTITPQAVVVSAISGPASGKVTAGYNATFSATVTGAVDTSLTWTSAGAGTWTGSTWTAPSTPGTYTLTATAINGATNTLTITVVAAPAISAFTTSPAGVNANGTSTLTATFSGAGTGTNASAVITPGNLALASGSAGVSTGALTTSQTYTLTVTNDAGDTATRQTTVQVFLGSFSATSNSLTPARALPTATLRADGQVLVAGGGSGSSAVDLFNSTALSFASSAALNTGRNGHTATLLPNGLVLIAGGTNGSSSLASAELYNPATGTFTVTGNLSVARRNHRAILLGTGKVLLTGGTGLSSAELYDPATGLFTTTGSMASVRDSATASILSDGRVLIAGGSNGFARLATTEIYDPTTATFSTGATMLQARQFQTATTLASGQILIAGGTGTTATGSAELFNPSFMRFAATGDMVQPRQEHVAALLPDGMVLFAGGNSGLATSAIDQAELFNPSTASFLKTDFMSTSSAPVTGAAATILLSGQVLVTGGTSNGSAAVTGSAIYTQTDALSAPAASATITAPGYASQGATAVAAHVTSVAGTRYIWSVTNGTLVSGQGTPSITFNMPATGNATIDVLLITGLQVPSHGQAVVVGEPAPTITSFTAALSPVPYGASTTITPVFNYASASAVIGTGAVGSSDITSAAVSGTAIPAGPLTAPVQYRLTVANNSGVSVSQTLTVAVQSIIVSAISPASPTLSANATQTFTASVTGAANTAVTWSSTGGTITSSGVWTAPATPGTYTITAASAADGVTHSSTTVIVVALPVIQSFTAASTTLNFNGTTTLTAVFTGAVSSQAIIGTSGSGSAQLSSAVVSGTALTTPALTASTTYTLTVTNTAGASATASLTLAVTQPFAPTGSLALARLGQTTTLLPDGTVLVAGGTAAADAAEIYTAANSAFASTQPMQAARRHHTATLLATGQVLLTGGYDATSTAENTAELFDPSTGAFTATAGSMAHARQDHTAALLPDGRVLIAGGYNPTEGLLASAEIFDPTTGSFTTTATSLVSARQFATATTLVDGRILIAGGANATTRLATAEIFSNGAFSTSPLAMGSARSNHTATLLNSGEVLFIGGYDGTSRLASSLLFTPGSPDSFSTSSSMAQARQDATASLLAGSGVLVAGGITNGTTALATSELFNASATSVSGFGSLNTARSGAGATLLPDGTVLIAGGTTDGTTALASAERFSPDDGLTPFQPTAAITSSTTSAYVGTTGLTAAVPAHAGNRYTWQVTDGTITAGQGSSSITYTLRSSGSATLDVLVQSDHLLPAHGRLTVTAEPLPQLTSFTASLNPVPFGGSTVLTPTFSNASGVTLGTAGSGSSNISSSVSSGTGIPVGPLTATTSYTLTFPTVDGTHITQTLPITVQPVLLSAITPYAPTISTGNNRVFSAAVSQAVNTAVTWSANGGSISTSGVWTAPSTPGTYTVTATAAADNTTTSTTVTVIALPSIQSFTAASATVNYGQTTTLTPAFTAPAGSQATIGISGVGSTQLAANATSGTAVTTSSLTATTIYTLTVTNAAGDSVTRSAQVTVTQPFSSTGSMAFARQGQAVTSLPDGTVLVTGGTGAADPAEIYTEGSAVFTPTSPMTASRRGHTATLLADGTVLITGGTDGTSILASAEIYHPSTHAFNALTGTMLHPRQNHAATLLPDGRVLLVGGSNTTESQLASVELYDPSTGAFTALTSSLVVPREYATATTLPSGDVVVTGGTGTGGATLNSAELYAAGAFGAQTFLLRSARTRHTATLLSSGQILLTGGTDGFAPLATAELYAGGSTNSSFTLTSGPMTTARQQHTSTLLAGGKVLLAGGSDGSSPIASAELFDPSLGTFAPAGTLVTARSSAGAALLQSGKVLLLGGTGASTSLSSAELFDPQDGVVPNLPSLSLSAPSTAPFGSTQFATINLPGNAFVAWSVSNGAESSGVGTGTLSFTMAPSGDTTVSVLVFTRSGLPLSSFQTVSGR